MTDTDAGVHEVDGTTLNELQQKHPQLAQPTSDILLNGPVNRVLPSYFDEIDETMVFKSACMTNGGGGPSRLDAEQYCCLLMSNQYKKENKELRVQLATLAWLLATKYLDPICLEVFVACRRLLPLDKNPGMHPIGAGEVTR